MSINISAGYGSTRIITHPDTVNVHKNGARIVVGASNGNGSETVEMFLFVPQAESLLAMLQSTLGKAT